MTKEEIDKEELHEQVELAAKAVKAILDPFHYHVREIILRELEQEYELELHLRLESQEEEVARRLIWLRPPGSFRPNATPDQASD